MKSLSVSFLTLAVVFTGTAIPVVPAYGQDGALGGNRYYLERYYAGEISAAKAYVDAVLANDWWRAHSRKLVILDVRTTSEYKAGHPEGAYNTPFPRIYRACIDNLRTDDGECRNGKLRDIVQDPSEFFAIVEDLFPDKSQPLATLCRTGSRSVEAANVLSSPETYLGDAYAGRGYSHVYNIWQGFVGQPIAGVISQSSALLTVGPRQTPVSTVLSDRSDVAGFAPYQLDLDNDGLYPSDGDADDKDGWRYHQGLPYSTRLEDRYLSKAADEAGYYVMP